MRIAVYCGSRSGGDPVFMQRAGQLGTWIGASGNELVYGGSQGGLMGAVADAALAAGASVTGVQPNVPLIKARRHPGVTTYIETETVAERRSEMIRLSDAFVALPGGPGTLDEISEVISLASLNIIDAPIVLVNTKSYYEPLREQIASYVKNGFALEENFQNVLFSDDMNEIAAFIAAREEIK